MRKIEVNVGNIVVGKEGEIVVQTMCNTATTDIEGSFNQCVQLSKAGAQIIRLTTQGIREVEALSQIKQKLRDAGIFTPLVADVHFSYNVALAAAKVADKVRVNPGNFAKDLEIAKREFANLIEVCKTHNTSIRIGVNHGSLGERITATHGNTPQGMAAVAMEWIEMAEQNNFDQIIVSLKASNTLVMTQAYKTIYKYMQERGVLYPLHLGVTEAGNGYQGRVKSAVGLATLLKLGIGNTIRVSLTETPVNEIPVAQFIANYFEDPANVLKEYNSNLIKEGAANIHKEYPKSTVYNCIDYQKFILRVSCDYGPLLLEKEIDNFNLSGFISGEEIPQNEIEKLKDAIMQAARRKFTKPEYIACPGCGRTLFNLEKVFEEVKERTSHLVGYNIAVMGCIVNGPGEMADAHYGYVGEGKGKVSIYRGKEPVYRSVPQDDAIDMLLELIEQDARNKVFHPQNE